MEYIAKKITVTWNRPGGATQQENYEDVRVVTKGGAHTIIGRDERMVAIWPVNNTIIITR
jgi:hypothetical protein